MTTNETATEVSIREESRGARPPTNGLNKLFVYGIFLDKSNRDHYGMTNPQYATVRDYATFTLSGSIVEAREVDQQAGAALTGLLVDVDPKHWKSIDGLEYGYNRVLIQTSNYHQAWMYVGR